MKNDVQADVHTSALLCDTFPVWAYNDLNAFIQMYVCT